MITDRRKFTTKITLYGISSFRFYRWNQFEVIFLESTLRTRNLPKYSATSDAGLTTLHLTLTSFSRRQPITIDY